jgi:RNA polymerase sigma factor (sigma-70 family)
VSPSPLRRRFPACAVEIWPRSSTTLNIRAWCAFAAARRVWNEAQDAAQDAFTQMCRPGTSISYPKAWLQKVAWRSWLRQQVRPEDPCSQVPAESVVHWQTPAYAAELGVEGRRVVELLLRLPAKQRAVLAWTLDGFTMQESAEAMGITPEAARQNLARARATLKAELSLEGFSGTAGEEE